MSGLQNVPTVLSTGDVARALGISRQAIHLRVKAGTLTPLAKTRAGYLFDAAEVERVRAERASRAGGGDAKRS